MEQMHGEEMQIIEIEGGNYLLSSGMKVFDRTGTEMEGMTAMLATDESDL